MLATLTDTPSVYPCGNTRGDTRRLFLYESWQYSMAILVNCSYDGNDANDGISLLEQGSVISVMSVITIIKVLFHNIERLIIFFRYWFLGYCEHIVAVA